MSKLGIKTPCPRQTFIEAVASNDLVEQMSDGVNS